MSFIKGYGDAHFVYLRLKNDKVYDGYNTVNVDGFIIAKISLYSHLLICKNG